jgi:hypothetical protein
MPLSSGKMSTYIYVSENLATVFRGAAYAVKLGRALRLPDLEFITFAQTMGYVRM